MIETGVYSWTAWQSVAERYPNDHQNNCCGQRFFKKKISRDEPSFRIQRHNAIENKAIDLKPTDLKQSFDAGAEKVNFWTADTDACNRSIFLVSVSKAATENDRKR